MTLSRMEVGVGVCATGVLLAVLPDVMAQRSPTPLWRIPVDVIPPTPMLAVRRETLDRSGPAEAVVDAMAAEIAGDA